MALIPVAKIADIPVGEGRPFEVNGKQIAVFNVDGKFHSIANVCPHRGGSLGDGQLSGKSVTCPLHAWEFDVETGDCISPGAGCVKTYPVEVQGADVLVNL